MEHTKETEPLLMADRLKALEAENKRLRDENRELQAVKDLAQHWLDNHFQGAR